MGETTSAINPIDQIEVSRQISLASAIMDRFGARTLGEFITLKMGIFNDDDKKVAQALVDYKVFEKSADCLDPLGMAREVVKRYGQFGEQLYPEEKPL